MQNTHIINKFLPESIQYLIGTYLIPTLSNITISKNMYKGIQNNKNYYNCFICNELNKCIFIYNNLYKQHLHICIECSKTNLCYYCCDIINFIHNKDNNLKTIDFDNDNDNDNDIDNDYDNDNINKTNNNLCERCYIYDYHLYY